MGLLLPLEVKEEMEVVRLSEREAEDEQEAMDEYSTLFMELLQTLGQLLSHEEFEGQEVQVIHDDLQMVLTVAQEQQEYKY